MNIINRLGSLIKTRERNLPEGVLFKNSGYCPICDANVEFIATGEWLRDSYLCSKCGSIPRERALMQVVHTYFPQWPGLVIHESSPIQRGTSLRLARDCKNYIPTQFFPGERLGDMINGIRCENLEALTFADESIDLHITQDVLEHVFSPADTFREIARTLRPGGAHIFTTPLINKRQPSRVRSVLSQAGEITYIEPPVYHGNPISDKGVLVTVDWGFDICEKIFDSCGLFTYLIYIDDITRGIRAEYIEVLVTTKPI